MMLRVAITVLTLTLAAQLRVDGLDPRYNLTEYEKQRIIDIHNDARREQGAADMRQIVWDDELAEIAMRWAQNCVFAHGQLENSYSRKNLEIGQNLYAKEGSTNKYGGVMNWISEGRYYDLATDECNGYETCGHFTQAVWSTSYKMGCAHFYCGDSLYWPERNRNLTDANHVVCQYWPPGNVQGAKPYVPGRPCTKCPDGKGWCKYGLCQAQCTQAGPGCDCPGLDCDNCGESVPETCTCNCKKGFHGNWCERVCRNFDPQCAFLKAAACKHHQYGATIKASCPATCGFCETQSDKNWRCDGKTWDDVFGVVDGK